MSLKVLHNPKKEYVIEFYRSLDAFKGDVLFSEFSDTENGENIIDLVNTLAYELEKAFPYLDSRYA